MVKKVLATAAANWYWPMKPAKRPLPWTAVMRE
jgi:hypothetical protein